MFLIHLRTQVVAINAVIDGVIGRNGMTLSAQGPCAAMPTGINGEIQTVMIPRGIPIRRRVARRAVMRKLRLCVVRVGCVIVIRRMTGIAICRRVDKLPVDVALQTSYGRTGMRAGQRVTNSAMIELRRRPGGGRMALRARVAQI
jgi:hypothetical protein